MRGNSGGTTRLDLDSLKPAAPATVAATEPGAPPAATASLLPKLPAAHFDVALSADHVLVQQATLHAVDAELRGDAERFELTLRADRLERETLRLHTIETHLEGNSETATGELRAQEGVLGKIGVEALRSNVVIAGTRIELPNLTGDAYAGRLNGKAVLDLTDATSPQQTIDASIEEVQLSGLLGDLWNVGSMVAGSVSGSTQLVLQGSDPSAIRQTLSAAGKGIAVNGRLRDMPLLSQLGEWLRVPTLQNLNYRELGFDFKVDSGRVRFPRVQLISQDAAIAVLGSVGLDGSLDLDVNVQLSEASTRSSLQDPLAKRVGSLFTDAQGHLVFDFDVRGTFKAPKLQPNLERTAARRGMKSVNQQDIRRLLGGIAENLGATPPTEDTLKKKLEDAAQDGVKDAIGGLFGKKKPTAAADSTRKP